MSVRLYPRGFVPVTDKGVGKGCDAINICCRRCAILSEKHQSALSYSTEGKVNSVVDANL